MVKFALLSKKIMRIVFILAAIILCYQCQNNRSAGVQEVDLPEFENILKTESNAKLVDVRTPEEYQNGYIANAININWYDKDFKSQILQLDTSAHIVLYCKGGRRSNQAAQVLFQNNYKHVTVLSGGFDSWSSAKKPISGKK
jgi:rhodanese-related sulfurtransferase